MTTNPTNLSAHGITPGDKISKYQITELIGQGGMSMVWKGHDPLIDRTVAIKQLTIDASDAVSHDAMRESFRGEANTLKQTAANHPHLVQMLDFIDEPRGLFIVMEFVDGVSLEQVLTAEAKPMDQRQALGIVAAAATALDHIHKQGIVHRDLKPANIMLPREGGLKICDFGLSTVIADQDAMTVGTVRYMAPECFSAGQVDGRADMYSLGLIAYEMLAGRGKFETAFKLVLRDTRNQAMRWMKWHTNQRAIATPLNQLNPDVPENLSELIGRMMEKDPLQRVSSASDLVAAIKRQVVDASAGAMDQSAARLASGSNHATAAIKKKSKIPLLLAAILIIQVGIGLVMWGVSENKKTSKVEEQQKAVMKEFNAARKLFDDGKWVQAKEAFLPFMEHEKFGSISDAASKWCDANLLYEAQLEKDLLDRDFQPVIDLCRELYDRPEMTKRQDEVRHLGDKAERPQANLRRIKEIQEIVKQGDFNTARTEIDDTLRTQQTSMTVEEKAALTGMLTMIDTKEHSAFFASALSDAESLVAKGRRQDAVETLNRAMQERGEHPKLRQLREKILSENAYAGTVAAAKEAETAGNLTEAIKQYAAADEMSGEQNYVKKIRLLKSDIAADDGQKAENRNDLRRATQKYLEALGFNPANAIALAGQRRIKDVNARDSREIAGDTASASGEFEVAIRHWKAAQDIELDPKTSAKIRKAELRIEVNKGVALARAGKKEEALKQLTPYESDAVASRWITTINTQMKFELYRGKGDSAYAGGDYPEAQRWFRKAEDIQGITAEQKRSINQRKDDAEYAHLMVKAKRDNQSDNLVQAEAWCVAAQRIKNTDEVQKLLAEVQAKKKKKEQIPE